MIQRTEKTCPRCQSLNMRSWHELDEDQQRLARALPPSTGYTLEELKKHRFCTNCWFQETERTSNTA